VRIPAVAVLPTPTPIRRLEPRDERLDRHKFWLRELTSAVEVRALPPGDSVDEIIEGIDDVGPDETTPS
jgi:hypothetical protein